MISIDETLEVAAPPDVVFGVLTRVERFPVWIPGLIGATALPGVAQGEPGARFGLRFKGPLGPLEADGRLLSARRPSALQVAASGAVFGVKAACELEPAGEGTRLHVAGELELKGMARFMEGQVRRQVASGMPAALVQLRTALEAEAAAAQG